MPRVAMDFSKTVIYHFICKDEMIKCSYVGSTTNFVKRKYQHKSTCNNETLRGHKFKVYQTIRDNGGWINWDMKPLEEYSTCESKTQQIIREQYWIDRLKPELNCLPAYREGETVSEKKKTYYVLNAEVIKEKSKAYRVLNSEAVNEYHKSYRKANSKVIAEYHKARYETNSKVIKEKKKVWREANRDRVNENRRNKYKLKKQQENEH